MDGSNQSLLGSNPPIRPLAKPVLTTSAADRVGSRRITAFPFFVPNYLGNIYVDVPSGV